MNSHDADKTLELAQKISRVLVECQCDINNITKFIEKNLERDHNNSPEYDVNWNTDNRVIKVTAYEYPPKLKVHHDNINYPTRGKSNYQVVRERWYNLIMNALEHLPTEFKLPMKDVLIWVKYWFPKNAVIDTDNYNLKFINDAIVYSNIYPDDRFQNMMVVIQGDYDHDHPRTEIMISEERNEFNEFYKKLSSCLNHQASTLYCKTNKVVHPIAKPPR